MTSSPFRRAALIVAACILTLPSSSNAIDKCKVKVGKDGVLSIDASPVSGTLRWGTSLGEEDNTFFNAGTCVADGKAKKCQIADPATLAAKSPPAGCTLYLDDDGAPCSVWVRGCSPGPRQSAGLLFKDADDDTVGTSDDSGGGAIRNTGSTFVRIGISAATGGYSEYGFAYFASVDCTGPALVAAPSNFVKPLEIFGPTGPAYYAADTGSFQAYSSYLYSTPIFVDQAACDSNVGPGSVYTAPHGCCVASAASSVLATGVSLDLTAFTPPFHLEEP